MNQKANQRPTNMLAKSENPRPRIATVISSVIFNLLQFCQ